MDSRLNGINSLCYLPQLQGKPRILFHSKLNWGQQCFNGAQHFVFSCVRFRFCLSLFFVCANFALVKCNKGTKMEKFCGKILCWEYNNFTYLLARYFTAVGIVPADCHDNVLFGHFLEGILIAYQFLFAFYTLMCCSYCVYILFIWMLQKEQKKSTYVHCSL